MPLFEHHYAMFDSSTISHPDTFKLIAFRVRPVRVYSIPVSLADSFIVIMPQLRPDFVRLKTKAKACNEFSVLSGQS